MSIEYGFEKCHEMRGHNIFAKAGMRWYESIRAGKRDVHDVHVMVAWILDVNSAIISCVWLR